MKKLNLFIILSLLLLTTSSVLAEVQDGAGKGFAPAGTIASYSFTKSYTYTPEDSLMGYMISCTRASTISFDANVTTYPIKAVTDYQLYRHPQVTSIVFAQASSATASVCSVMKHKR